jgi:hypothetical protein
MDGSSSSEDGKPSAREAIAPAPQAVVMNSSGRKDEASNSRRSENTKEFYHALNHLPTEMIPSYTRDFDSILTFPEKASRAAIMFAHPNPHFSYHPSLIHLLPSSC